MGRMGCLKRNIRWIVFICILSSLSCFIVFLQYIYVAIPLAILTVVLYSVGLSNRLRRWSESDTKAFDKIILRNRFWD